MKNKIEYTKGEIGKVKIIKDFLPSPSELVLAKGPYQSLRDSFSKGEA